MLSSVTAADFAGLPILRGYSFKGVRIPLNVNPHIKSDIFLEIKQIDIQAKKFDFFALSSVPQMVFQRVKIIVNAKTNPALTLKSLAEFSGENPQFQTGRMEGVTLVDSSGNILLSANQGSMSRSGTTLIFHEVSLNLVRPEIIAKGRLDLIGPDSGKLFWDESGIHHAFTVLPSPQ
jgi:hypothetical protein